MSCLDQAKLAQLIELMPRPMFVELVELYMANSAKHLNGIKAALIEQDLERLRFHAHSLKGSSANIGARQMAEQAFTLEEMGRSGTLTENGEAVYAALQHLHACVVTELQQRLAMLSD